MKSDCALRLGAVEESADHDRFAGEPAHPHDERRVRAFPGARADDAAIWAHAGANGLVLLTKDEDFAMRAQQVHEGPAVVWLRVGNSSIRALRPWLEPRLPGILQLVAQGSRLVEVI